MLRNIPKSLSPDLVKVLMQMGHGDEIVLGDANFPAHSHSDQVLRADGLHIPDLLRDILTLIRPVTIRVPISGTFTRRSGTRLKKRRVSSRSKCLSAMSSTVIPELFTPPWLPGKPLSMAM